jgi:hypothetical protein
MPASERGNCTAAESALWHFRHSECSLGLWLECDTFPWLFAKLPGTGSSPPEHHVYLKRWGLSALVSMCVWYLMNNTGELACIRSCHFIIQQFYVSCWDSEYCVPALHVMFPLLNTLQYKLRFQVLTAVNSEVIVFWNVVTCSLVDRYHTSHLKRLWFEYANKDIPPPLKKKGKMIKVSIYQTIKASKVVRGWSSHIF